MTPIKTHKACYCTGFPICASDRFECGTQKMVQGVSKRKDTSTWWKERGNTSQILIHSTSAKVMKVRGLPMISNLLGWQTKNL